MPWSVTFVVGAAEPGTTEEHVFTGSASCTVGRGRECGIRVPADERRVSRRHCQFDIRPPHLYVRDLGSHNGTYVNGHLVRGRHELKDGDEILIGDTSVWIALCVNERTEPMPGLRTLRELGRGAQGVVRLARHTASGRLVAVKTLTGPVDVDPLAREVFLREMDCTKALRHPNIVRFGESAADALCFTCEYCAAGSLAGLVLHRGGRLGRDEAIPLVLQALNGLAYAHSAQIPTRLADGRTITGHGLVHRDIKPQNLLLAGDARRPVVKIADFGLAKAIDQAGLSGQTRSGAIGGSLAFMPRRQLVDYKYAQPDVDLWAIMACLYWMLTGQTPRDFPPAADPVAVVLREPPVPVRERLPTIPEPLADVIDTTLAETAGTGPASASVLSMMLRQVARV